MLPSPNDPRYNLLRALSNPNISNRGVPNDQLLAFVQLVERSIQCSDPTQKWELVMRTLVAIEQDYKMEGKVREIAQVLLEMVNMMGLLAEDIRKVHRQPISQVPSTPRPPEHLQPPSARPNPPPIPRSAPHPPTTSRHLALPRRSIIPGAWPTSDSASISTLIRCQSASQAVPPVRKKLVRFNSKKDVQEANGQEHKDRVVDNEGKTRRKRQRPDGRRI